MCRSLANKNIQVSLIVADGKSNEIRDGVQIYDVGVFDSRVDRIKNAPKRVLKKALTVQADLYHLHDPELIPIGLKLKQMGRQVVFDSHEDVPKQMLTKPYLNYPMLRIISTIFGLYENYACHKLDGVIAATPFIRDKFLKINQNTIDINNFPLLDELSSDISWSQKRNEICYVGGLSRIRGILEIVQAMSHTQSYVRLNLCGRFLEPEFEDICKKLSGWQKINALGFLGRQGVSEVLERSMAGLVTLHPTINYLDSLPVKMFEYMAAGIPVIASDFPLWREIIAGNDCGLLVDPLNSQAIADAIDYLIQNPKEAERLGGNGRKAVLEKYNWPIEEKKLLSFYSMILSGKTPTT
jgi:glycosyltransferase involved in cell wall biosynthesis